MKKNLSNKYLGGYGFSRGFVRAKNKFCNFFVRAWTSTPSHPQLPRDVGSPRISNYKHHIL